MAGIEIGKAAELRQQEVSCFQYNGQKFVLIYNNQQFFLLDDECPHKAASLCEGRVHNGAIECPWHKARFELTSGKGLSPLAGAGVRSYTVTEIDGVVRAEMAAEE